MNLPSQHKPLEPPLARHDTRDFLPVETARACSTMRRAGTVCNAIRGGLTMPRVQNQLLGVWLRVCLWLVMHISRTCFHCTKLYYVTTAAPQRAYSARSRGVPARLGRFKKGAPSQLVRTTLVSHVTHRPSPAGPATATSFV